MTNEQSILARAALGTSVAACGFVAISVRYFWNLPKKSFDRLATGLFLASRFLLYFLVFLVLRVSPRGDIPGLYFPEAQKVLAGLLPYKDFPSSYAPLHPYMDASLICLWMSPLVLILFAIAVESILIPVWLKMGRSFLSERHLRTGILLYLASPISLQFVAIDGQDNVIIAALLALATIALLKNRAALSGLLLAIGLVFVKFLALLYVPAYFLTAKSRLRWLAGFVPLVLLGYGAFLWMRVPILYPLSAEGNIKSPGDLPYLIESLSGITFPGRLADAFVVIILLALFAIMAKELYQAPAAARMRILTFGVAALTLALILFAKRSWPNYLVLGLFPICLLFDNGAAQRLRIVIFDLFCINGLVVYSYWNNFLFNATSMANHKALLRFDHAMVFFTVLHIILIGGYIWLLVEAIDRLLHAKEHTLEDLPALGVSAAVPG